MALFPTIEQKRAALLTRIAETPVWEPKPLPVSLAQLVAGIEAFIRKYMVLPALAYLPIALWIVATYIFLVFDSFPYLAVMSPMRRCGKTRLLEILYLLARSAWMGTAPTPAALFRMMAEHPTLLLDEIEILNSKNKSEQAQTILAVLNSGYKKGATVPRCVEPKHELEYFPVYSPKSFAVIGTLPDTLVDRSIVVKIQRKGTQDKAARFLGVRAEAEAKPIKDGLLAFATANEAAIADAYETCIDMDLPYLNDRDADIWIPLFSVCAVACPGRQKELEGCAKTLCDAKAEGDEDSSLSLRLLADIREVWPKDVHKNPEESCFSSTLVSGLATLEESSWAEYKLTQRKLAKRLSPYGITPRTVRVGEKTGKGYTYKPLEDAFRRYLDNSTAVAATDPSQSVTNQDSCVVDADFASCHLSDTKRNSPSQASQADPGLATWNSVTDVTDVTDRVGKMATTKNETLVNVYAGCDGLLRTNGNYCQEDKTAVPVDAELDFGVPEGNPEPDPAVSEHSAPDGSGDGTVPRPSFVARGIAHVFSCTPDVSCTVEYLLVKLQQYRGKREPAEEPLTLEQLTATLPGLGLKLVQNGKDRFVEGFRLLIESHGWAEEIL